MKAFATALIVSFLAIAPAAFAGDCGCKHEKGAKCECGAKCDCKSCGKDGKTCEHKEEKK